MLLLWSTLNLTNQSQFTGGAIGRFGTKPVWLFTRYADARRRFALIISAQTTWPGRTPYAALSGLGGATLRHCVRRIRRRINPSQLAASFLAVDDARDGAGAVH